MSILRFLGLPLLVSSFVVPVSAQSPGDKAPALPKASNNASAAHAGSDSMQRPVVAHITVEKGSPALAENKGVCYTMRSYGFARDDGKSDLTKPVSYSTCQPSKQFEMKAAVATKAVAPR